MSKRILLMLAHSIEEHDQLKLLSGLGYEVLSIGGYIDPAHPHDTKRPPLDVPFYPDLKAAVDELGADDNLDAAQRHIPDKLLDWADTIIVHHREHTVLVPQWDRIRGHRVIWRTVGQSVEGNERMMAPLHEQGLQIVRYSLRERNIPAYAGEDTLIRFYKDPDEWKGWTGTFESICNVTQHLLQRDPYTNYGFWQAATEGLTADPAGPGSEAIDLGTYKYSTAQHNGLGPLPYEGMKKYLQAARCYLYTGTQPASYTLGLIEAMMTGTPIVSIGPSHMKIFPYGPDLFEGHEIAGNWADDPGTARAELRHYLDDYDAAKADSALMRAKAIELFGKDKIAAEWKAYLG